MILSEHINERSGNTIVIGDKRDYETVLISNILEADVSYIVNDPEGEYFDKMFTFLENQGYNVVNIGKGSSRCNIFSGMDTFGIRDFCMALSPRNKVNRIVIEVMLRFCFYKIPPEDISIFSIKELLTDYQGKYLDAVSELKEASEEEGRISFALMLNDGAIGRCLEPLFQIDPDVEDVFMKRSEFNFEDIFTSRCAVFLKTPDEYAGIIYSAVSRRLMNYGDIFDFSKVQAEEKEQGERIQAFIFLGNLASCRIQNPDIAFGGSETFGFSFISYAGSLTEIEELYGKEKEAVLDYTKNMVFVRADNKKTAEYFCQFLSPSVMRPNEMLSRPEGLSIVFSKGEMPAFSDVFDVAKHPNYRYIKGKE